VSKSVPPRALAAAIAAVRKGEAVIQLDTSDRILSGATDNDPALTPRQIEVLRLLAEGKTNKEIAAAISHRAHGNQDAKTFLRGLKQLRTAQVGALAKAALPLAHR
jgi:hypothetical protein